jgi:hypothetical protein
MSLLQQEIERKVRLAAGNKVVAHVRPDHLDQALVGAVGRYFGTSATATTIREAFLFAASRAIDPASGLLSGIAFDKAQRLLRVIEGSGGSNGKGKPHRSFLKVTVLRWTVMAVANAVLDGETELRTAEQLVNAVLELCKRDLDLLFRSGGKERK